MNVRDIGPLYCETPVDVVVGAYFPVEPINTLTSLVPAALGVLAFLILRKQGAPRPELLLASLLLILVGIGSTLWHSFRTPLSLTLDWVPGVFLLLLTVFLWPTYLRNRWWGYALLPAIFALQFLLAPLLDSVAQNGPPVSLFATIALVGALLTVLTFKKDSSAGWWGLAAVLTAIAAATARTVDLATCNIVPVGTHFMWHIFLSTAAFCSIITLTKLQRALK